MKGIDLRSPEIQDIAKQLIAINAALKACKFYQLKRKHELRSISQDLKFKLQRRINGQKGF